jgi:FkbM family methyltransferase
MSLSDLFVKPGTKFYKRTILKDPFSVSVKQWKRDRGDSTLRFEYPLDENSVVLDVGGYQGDFAHALVERFRCQVLLFEPMPMFCQKCEERFAHEPKVSVFNYGLGAEDEQLSLSTDDDASSFFRGKTPDKTVPAEVRDVRSVWEELELGRVDLMKINIEGSEYPLLRRLIETKLIQQVDNIQVQFHDFVNEAARQRDELRRQLEPTHNETWCYEFVWENWARRKTAA